MTDDKPRYLPVRVRIVRPSTNAVCVAAGPITAWIPLSLIHGADEINVRMSDPGDTLTLRVMDWKVAALGLPVINHDR